MASMVKTVAVRKIYNRGLPNEVCAIDGVNFEVEEGELVVVKGPSGSGKTTLLTLVGCMARPTSGEVVVKGKTVSKLPERFLTLHRRAHIGFIFQQFHLMPHVRVMDNIGVPLLPLGIPPREREVRTLELLEKLNLMRRKEFYVRQLSGGEQQRVAIARALINNPSIILADEPTAHLDTHLSSEFLAILVSLKNEGRTVIIASHDPLIFEAGSVDRVHDMRDGRIVGVES